MNSGTRIETDSMGAIEVPEHALWGAQTARSLRYFAIGEQRMPAPIIEAMAWIKWAGAKVNRELGLLEPSKARAIERAAADVAQGAHADEFPLSVWQTGSGTQSHMNLNEVLAALATKALASGRRRGADAPNVHPNDDVNRGQSSNDVFPSAMHLATLLLAHRALLPALDELHGELAAGAQRFDSIIKPGRTHLQDATPVTLGQEYGGYAAQLAICRTAIVGSMTGLEALAIGGTAVGTGVNTHAQFGARVAASLSRRLQLRLRQADNLFAALSGHEALVGFHASLRTLAVALNKIASDFRLMGSGPRAGLGELRLPENEPGSSIMPGKVNPTQVEALTMICAQVMGHDVAIGFAASQGQFELNVYKPLIALDTLDSVRLLADGMRSFSRHCVAGARPHEARMRDSMQRSLMLVTGLTPHIGYARASRIARHALESDMSLRDAALTLGEVGAEDFDRWTDPARMLRPGP